LKRILSLLTARTASARTYLHDRQTTRQRKVSGATIERVQQHIADLRQRSTAMDGALKAVGTAGGH